MSLAFAALKLKRGEIEALKQSERDTVAAVTPVFDVARPSSRMSIDERISESITLIQRGWPWLSRPVLLDLRDLPLEARLGTGTHPVEGIAQRLGFYGQQVTHCFGFDRDIAYEEAFCAVVTDRLSRGFALRLELDDLKLLDVTEGRIRALLSKLGRSLDEAFVLFDLRSIHGSTEDLAGIVTRAYQRIAKLNPRRVVLLASSMWDYSLLKSDRVTRVPRSEITLFDFLRRSGVPIAYGDYGVIAPSFIDTERNVIPAPKLRYATPTCWLVSKGEKPRTGENSQYPRLAKRLLGTGEFRSNDLGWGHDQIRAFAARERQTTDHAGAVAIDTCTHIDVTVRQLKVLEERLKLGV
jgi:hypothetical protein